MMFFVKLFAIGVGYFVAIRLVEKITGFEMPSPQGDFWAWMLHDTPAFIAGILLCQLIIS